MRRDDTEALQALLKLIADGYEYPDAEWIASGRGKIIDPDRLREMYDRYCASN